MYQILSSDLVLAKKVFKAESFWDKLCGLMFKENLGNYDGILFETKSIHTHFMKFDIDVIFFNSQWKVIRVIRGMKPWRITKIYFDACYALEMASGSIESNVSVGDQFEVVCIN